MPALPNIQANQYLNESPLVDELMRMGYSTAEIAAMLGSGAFGEVAGGWAGLMDLFKTGDFGSATDTINRVSDKFTYTPRSETAQEWLGNAAPYIEKGMEYADDAAVWLEDKTGIPRELTKGGTLAALEVTPFGYGLGRLAQTGKNLPNVPSTGPLNKQRGTIIGPNALVDWDETAAKQAQDAWDSGKYTGKTGEKSKVGLVEDTGYYPDRANNWKTQIPDNESTLKPQITTDLQSFARKGLKEAPEGKLTDYWNHKKLYDNYPQIAAKTTVRMVDDLKGALASVDAKMDLNGNLGEAIMEIDPRAIQKYARKNKIPVGEVYRRIFVHEGQHIVQAVEKHPGGGNIDYFKEAKDPKNLRLWKARLKQYPNPDAPRAQQIRDHIEFMERISDVPDGVVYRHTLGEADAGWTEAMRKDPNVRNKLPLHEREVGLQYWMDETKPFNPEWSAITSREDQLSGGLIKSESRPIKMAGPAKPKAKPMEYQQGPFGMDQFNGEKLSIAGGFPVATQKGQRLFGTEGTERLQFSIFDHTKPKTPEVGTVQINLRHRTKADDPFEVEGLVDIKIKPEYQKQGYGKEMVEELAGMTGGKGLNIYDIKPKAKGFWKNLGVEFKTTKTGGHKQVDGVLGGRVDPKEPVTLSKKKSIKSESRPPLSKQGDYEKVAMEYDPNFMKGSK